MANTDSKARQALLALRLAVATLIFIHGVFRLWSGGVAGFGEFLNGSHIPMGPAVAWWITIAEIAGTPLLAIGRWIRPLALYYAAELSVGIALVHAREGWFVVGGGRNGAEYSLLLIVCFLVLAWAHPRPAEPA